ncbi:MAG: aminomethyl-transferring glycine dehydrogenase [Bacteroidota bacterium]
MTHDSFADRHIGPSPADREEMLGTLGLPSLEALMDETIPAGIRIPSPPPAAEPVSEFEYLRALGAIAAKNRLWKTYIGLGYNPTVTPAVIQRNILENPGWYTQYTPYQAEVAQGRLEALLNFQTVITDLTGMDVANASLLDEGTAAAEAMIMAHGIAARRSGGKPPDVFFASGACFPQTLDVLHTRAEPLGITIVEGDCEGARLDGRTFGMLVQYPDKDGAVRDHTELFRRAHAHGITVVAAADLLALALLCPPSAFGADIVVGSAQRFGVPMGYGGPHAAFFATRAEHIRFMPGRIIGVSVDSGGDRAYRMTLQTREQHIRREKATSNICTAQALLAVMAGMYAVYHGPQGLERIARRVHSLAAALEEGLTRAGYRQENAVYFDTLRLVSPVPTTEVRAAAEEARINLRYLDERHFTVSLDETTGEADVEELIAVLAGAAGRTSPGTGPLRPADPHPAPFRRTTPYLSHPVFHRHRSETRMMRYIKTLENRDLSLVHAMIPLGSCTMKLNAAAELLPVTWPAFSGIHPFVPREQAEGYGILIRELEQALCAMTGLAAASLQPNSGAQGEYTGLLVIRAYHARRGESHRNVVLIPSSAHGTNPASAVMAGYRVVVVRSDEAGNIDTADLRAQAREHAASLAALMVTYPSTHGIFEESIREICAVVHEHGGQVYMDGANLNAQVGLTSPAAIGADVCHINLHKTFAIPHGGGGPGMGPICVAAHLAPFLPGHPVVRTGGAQAIRAVASAPWGSASILPISHAYISMLGGDGLKLATQVAILNANYLKTRLEKHYRILYTGSRGRCAHEFILDLRPLREETGVEVEDVAKRLMDYGFHAPTVSFPVPGTLMIEPTESEPKEELDRFVEAMISIREEIREIAEGKADRTNNLLKNAPHTMRALLADSWSRPYARARAAFPAPSLAVSKFWPHAGRIDNPYGDRHIMCTCPPVESYGETTPG